MLPSKKPTQKLYFLLCIGNQNWSVLSDDQPGAGLSRGWHDREDKGLDAKSSLRLTTCTPSGTGHATGQGLRAKSILCMELKDISMFIYFLNLMLLEDRIISVSLLDSQSLVQSLAHSKCLVSTC